MTDFFSLTHEVLPFNLAKVAKTIELDENSIRSINFKSKNNEVLLVIRMKSPFHNNFFWREQLADSMKNADIDYEFYLYPAEVVIKGTDINTFFKLVEQKNSNANNNTDTSICDSRLTM